MTCFMDILIALRDDHEAVGNSHLAIERDFQVNVYVRETLTYRWCLKPQEKGRYPEYRFYSRQNPETEPQGTYYLGREEDTKER